MMNQYQLNDIEIMNENSMKSNYPYYHSQMMTNNNISQEYYIPSQQYIPIKTDYPINNFLLTNLQNCPSNNSQIFSTQVTVREQKELEIRQRLILKCEEFLKQVLLLLKNNQKLEICTIDLEKNSKFNYDLGYFTLNISSEGSCLETGEKIKYLTYDLYNDSDRLAKLFKVTSIIYTKSLNNNLTTKRELYYNDVELFKNTQCIDTILLDICSIFNLSRFDLSVFPAQKGLFAGDIIIFDLEGNMLNNSKSFDKINLISFEYFHEEIRIETNAKFILVVEKESLFFNLIGNKFYQEHFSNSIIITGKGFPDYLTKFFIKKISIYFEYKMPIFYFGDYDPSGFEIYLNYLFGCKTSARENEMMCLNNITWIGLSYENIQNLLKNEGEECISLIKLDEKEIKKINTILNKEYLNVEAWDFTTNPFKQNILFCINRLYNQLEMMREFQYRAEGEAIISKYMNHFIEYLHFILNRDY